jgi:hypothetical protein
VATGWPAPDEFAAFIVYPISDGMSVRATAANAINQHSQRFAKKQKLLMHWRKYQKHSREG